MILYVRVNKRDRERLLQWATKHTTVSWGSGHSPWPCLELVGVDREIWLGCDEAGLFTMLMGEPMDHHVKGEEEPKILNPYLFCLEVRRLFPRAKRYMSPEIKKTPQLNRQYKLFKGELE